MTRNKVAFPTLMMNGQIQATLSRKGDESIDLDEMIKEIDHE